MFIGMHDDKFNGFGASRRDEDSTWISIKRIMGDDMPSYHVESKESAVVREIDGGIESENQSTSI